MNRTFATVALLSMFLLPLAAQDPAPGTLPHYLRAQAAGMETNYLRLAEAIPADKYTWRPGPGVRSVSEVLLHVAGANYNFPRMAGVASPAGIDLRNFEQSTTDKAKVIEILKASFAHARQVVEKQTPETFSQPVKLFGQDSQVREIFLVMNHHMHEHMGQLIAYARVNGVVPPWTEDRLQQQKQAPPKK